MTTLTVVVGILLTAQQGATTTKTEAKNPIYSALRDKGWAVGSVRVAFPAPVLDDATSADAETAALKKLAGSDRALADLTRDSVNAPMILKIRDEADAEQGVVRLVDLWFVVRASLDEIKPDSLNTVAPEGQAVEAANMRFSASRMTARQLADRSISAVDEEDRREWFLHLSGRLLDRIQVEATDRIFATRGPRSWVVASTTDPRFNSVGDVANRWHAITRRGGEESTGAASPYPGGAGYATITTLATVPGALLVESHGAYYEPKGWFNGAPILRSKIGVVTQDRVRSLRRDLAKSRKGEGSRSSSGRPRD
jgi:hypothetical protein